MARKILLRLNIETHERGCGVQVIVLSYTPRG